MRFTKERRQEIVQEFAVRHNGTFNPKLFLEEVRRRGIDHPAYEWFEWNKERAFDQYQVEQAREFARDLRVTFSVEEVGRKKAITVREVPMPMVLSPVSGRSHGGGYFLADPGNPEHMQEHCRQAAAALRSWFDRYQAVLPYAGLEMFTVLRIAEKLEAKAPPADYAA